MKNKSILIFLILLSFLTFISCKKEYNPEDEASIMRNKADSLVSIGYKKYDSKDFEEAYNYGKEAISYSPGYPEALVLMGKVQIEVENYSRAIELFTFAIDDPGIMQHYQLEEVYQKRAFSKEKLKDYRGALVDYNILVESYSNNSYGYYHRGILKYDFLNDVGGACSDWSIAGEKGDSRAYDLIDKFCNNY